MQSNGSSLRLLGQAQLAGESPEELLARFEPGEPLSLRMAAEVWPEVPLVQRSSYIGLTLRLRGREVEGAKREEALLELRRRFPRPDGSLPELDDQLAAEVSSGLTAAALRDLVEERLKREAALAASSAAFEAAEEALLGAVAVDIPTTMVKERARAQYAERCRQAEAAALDGDAASREELRSLMTWDAFSAFLASEEAAISRSLALSFAIEAVSSAEGLAVDEQAVTDNLFLYVNECKRNERPVPDMDDPAFRESFEAQYVREAVLRLVVDHAQVEWLP